MQLKLYGKNLDLYTYLLAFRRDTPYIILERYFEGLCQFFVSVCFKVSHIFPIPISMNGTDLSCEETNDYKRVSEKICVRFVRIETSKQALSSSVFCKGLFK